MGEIRKAYKSLVWKTGGNRPLGRPRGRLVDNIKWFMKIQYMRALAVSLRIGSSNGFLWTLKFLFRKI
jgi:hypothetical protein